MEVDGSEGGGQLLRTSLALAAMRTEPLTLTGIRADRPEPGLRPQHLATLSLIGRICTAEIDGDSVGSTEVEFLPNPPVGGEYEIDIGTAGSITLLFNAVLPLAAVIDDALTVTVTGGTDVKWSPPMAYFKAVKLPLLRQYGLLAAVTSERTAYYPAGGGAATLFIGPSALSSFTLDDPGAPDSAHVYSKASMNLASQQVAERQAATATEALETAGWGVRHQETVYDVTLSPGSSITVRLDYERSLAGFDALGERGKPSEEVAKEAVDGALAFADTPAAVDRHMADQLLVFLASTGGRILIPVVTDHVETSLNLLQTFGYDVSVDKSTDRPTLVGSPE